MKRIKWENILAIILILISSAVIGWNYVVRGWYWKIILEVIINAGFIQLIRMIGKELRKM